jgi:hypothetical protein
MAGSFRDGVGPGDAPPPTPIPTLAQYLSLDPLPWAADPKHSRHAELRRALAADDQPDELRRIRASVSDSTTNARYLPTYSSAAAVLLLLLLLLLTQGRVYLRREKVRSLHDAIQKLDKYKNIVTRKRLRSESGLEKLSSGALRMGAQNNSAVMSKRVRSSLADARVRASPLFPFAQCCAYCS